MLKLFKFKQLFKSLEVRIIKNTQIHISATSLNKNDGTQTESSVDKIDEKISLRQYYKTRCNEVKQNPSLYYPHKFDTSISVNDFIEKYSSLSKGEISSDRTSIAGRIYSRRDASKKLIFFDVRSSDDKKIQIMATAKHYKKDADFEKSMDRIRLGDIVGVNGNPCKTKLGELSIRPEEIVQLAPCLHDFPSMRIGLVKTVGKIWRNLNLKLHICCFKEKRYRKRYLDLLVNDTVKQKFITKAKIVKYLRNYLDNLGFVEVETPILNWIPGGAIAKPFQTYHNDLEADFYLRISPELYLKQLVIGGMDRVYEIGRNFRNESIDITHNPEFTMCEFYMAYADYNDMMRISEECLSGLVKQLFGDYKIKYHPNPCDENESYEIDFTPPFKRLSIIEELEKALGVKLPPAHTFNTPEALEFFSNICDKHNIQCSKPVTTAKCIDKLISHFLEKNCRNPTFICDFPEILSPLAKSHRSKPGLTERFELIVGHTELCNAYTELNNPFVQKERFEEQDKENGKDTSISDDDYIKALEHALPPTAGLGIGIDRLTMFLTDSNTIKEVLLFPAMKSKNEK